jgi:putative spermidine/putrescine transport system permease protein
MMKGDFRENFGRGMVLGGAWTILAFLILPMVVVIPVSLTDQYYLSLPQDGISFRHYAAFFTNEIWLSATWQSIVIATLSTVFAVIMGSLCAIGCWRLSTNASEAVRTLMLTPIIVPTIVQALAMYRFWIDLGLLDTYAGVILAHTLVAIPYVVITVSASLANFDVRLEQAARSLGASMPETIRLVIMPRIVPGMLSGAIFAFTISFDEIVMVLFLTSRGIYTLPKRIWDGIENHLDPTIAAVATLLIIVTLALLLLELWSRQRRARRLKALAAEGGE